MKLRCHSHSDPCKKMCIITVELVIEVMKDLGVRIDLVTPAWLRRLERVFSVAIVFVKR